MALKVRGLQAVQYPSNSCVTKVRVYFLDDYVQSFEKIQRGEPCFWIYLAQKSIMEHKDRDEACFLDEFARKPDVPNRTKNIVSFAGIAVRRSCWFKKQPCV